MNWNEILTKGLSFVERWRFFSIYNTKEFLPNINIYAKLQKKEKEKPTQWEIAVS